MSNASANRDAVFDEVTIGAELPALVKVPTTVQLFRYSAVTWNAHRIHYEREYAQREGHPDVLVQAHLHGAFLAQLVMDWAGPRARLVSFGWSNRGRAVPGDTLTCTGRVTGKRVEGDRHLVDVEVVETNQRSEVCAPGKATVLLPAARTSR
jgi:hydroxyacyl-ACP dehydratase HTD2-like protein with hotdog domain